MKKFTITALVLILIAGFGLTPAFSAGYVSGNLGLVMPNDSDFNDGFDTGTFSFDSGIGFTGAFGGTLGNGGRAEIELGYRSNDLDAISIDGLGTLDLTAAGISGDASSLSLMGNMYYDFVGSGSFTPFVGVGLGFSKVEVELKGFGTTESYDDTVLAGQVMLGGGFAASEGLNIDLQYRLFATADPSFSGLDTEYSTHNFMIGLRHTF